VVEQTVHGDVDEGYGKVADEFRRNFVDRRELGASCAVVRDGRTVVDLWGGHRDRKRTKPWERDTLVTVWSTTKGMAATAMAVAHSRGLFELDATVATYWPEFAQAGKESITVRQLLAHEAGLPVIDVALDIETIADVERFGQILAAQPTKWRPGTTHGYHAQSLGWYESQLLRRVDPQRRTIGRYFADEVAAVLGVELHIGLPDEVPDDRLATFVGGSRAGQALHAREVPWPVLRRMMNPRSMTLKAFTNPKAITRLSDINRRSMLRVELPSVNGTGTAHAVASVYGDLASGAPALGVARGTLDELEATTPPSFDEIFGIESAFRFGFMKPFPILPFGSSAKAYGHTGSGGSFGYADPDARLGYAYVMNRNGYSLPTDPREIALRTALQTSLASA
jgi:CubicO group peptidase (beta-lactamase class C family)